MISVKGLKKSYSGIVAVDDLNFEVKQGVIYGLLGPNGAGKSTTMNILTGYISATEGEVRIDGVDILEEPEQAKAKIGYLPELPPLYPDMTVKEYLKFVCGLKKVKKANVAGQLDYVMQAADITDKADRLIKNLSKGYKQRVGIAQALIGEPKVIILDEPTVGLDPKQIIEIRELIKSLGKKHTVILSSHILSEVSEICDEILIINGGRLVAQGTPEQLTSSINSKTTLVVTVKGEEQAARAALAELEGISAEYAAGAEQDTVEISIETADETDIRAQVSAALAGAGLIILGMKLDTLSLEDIFLKLTGDITAEEQAEEANEA